MNKIIVSIVFAIILVLGINKLTEVIFYVEKPDKSAYQVSNIGATTEGTTSETNSEQSSSENIMALFASVTAADGEKVFKKCAACHSIVKGGKNNIGPALYNVVNRQVGVVSDYKYSKALTEYGKNWTFEELNGYLIRPAKWIKGTKMAFAVLKKEKDRASVILYLNQNSDNPLPLP